MSHYEEADEYCPHCDNQYVLEAEDRAPQMVHIMILMASKLVWREKTLEL
jgi:hypothetical protein